MAAALGQAGAYQANGFPRAIWHRHPQVCAEEIGQDPLVFGGSRYRQRLGNHRLADRHQAAGHVAVPNLINLAAENPDQRAGVDQVLHSSSSSRRSKSKPPASAIAMRSASPCARRVRASSTTRCSASVTASFFVLAPNAAPASASKLSSTSSSVLAIAVPPSAISMIYAMWMDIHNHIRYLGDHASDITTMAGMATDWR